MKKLMELLKTIRMLEKIESIRKVSDSSSSSFISFPEGNIFCIDFSLSLGSYLVVPEKAHTNSDQVSVNDTAKI